MVEDPILCSYDNFGDAAAYRRICRTLLMRQPAEWVRYGVRLIPWLAIAGYGSYAIGSSSVGQFTYTGGLAAAASSILWSIVWTIHEYDRSLTSAADQYLDGGWKSYIAEKSYRHTDRDGITTCIPWETMRIELEDPDVWHVTYGDTSTVVFREPLRQAGLENEFLKRVGKEPRQQEDSE